jgi:hypothetical protein
MNSKFIGYKRHPPPFSLKSDFLFVTSPLPWFNIPSLDNCEVGKEYLGRGIKAHHLVVVAGCDAAAAKYLSSSRRLIIVCSCGDGLIGVGGDETTFGTAGLTDLYRQKFREEKLDISRLSI